MLDKLDDTFVQNDPLLASIGMVSIYYLLGAQRRIEGREYPGRSRLVEFDQFRKPPRRSLEDEVSPADYVLLEFSRLAQSPNDGGALNYRLAVLNAWIEATESALDPTRAVGTLYDELDESS